MEESILMAKAASNQGITNIVASPHHRTSRYDNDRDSVLVAVDHLNQRLQEEGIAVTIHPAQEIRIHSDMSQTFNADELLTINDDGQYLLLELPFDHIPTYTEHLLFNLQTQGYTPIIVHPERHHTFLEHPNKLFDLIQHGALTQLTAGSLTGQFGKQVKKLSESLLTHHYIHLIASDAHHYSKRGFQLQDSYRAVSKMMGRRMTSQLMENAEHVLTGKKIVLDEPYRIKKKRFFGLF
jgi:protein-tyrosine phosphatase